MKYYGKYKVLKSVLTGQDEQQLGVKSNQKYKIYYECKLCKGKRFSGKNYLLSHYKRRHPNHENPSFEPQYIMEKSKKHSITPQVEEFKYIKNEIKSSINKNYNESLHKSKIERDQEMFELKNAITELSNHKDIIEKELENLKRFQAKEKYVKSRPSKYYSQESNKISSVNAFSTLIEPEYKGIKPLKQSHSGLRSEILRDNDYIGANMSDKSL